jgi:hypothetical protein
MDHILRIAEAVAPIPLDLPQRENVVSLQLAGQELSVIGIHQARVIDLGHPTGSCRGTGG